MEEQQERRKTVKWYTCKECGHVWKSYGYQKRVFCPKCHENRTGKKLGASSENLAKARAAKAAKKAAREAEVNSAPKIQEPETTPQPQDEKKPSILDRFLNKEIF